MRFYAEVVMALLIFVLSFCLIDSTAMHRSQRFEIVELKKQQAKWCPHEVQGRGLIYSTWNDEPRRPDTGVLTCYYKKGLGT